jgi:hypothetical protein
MRWGNPFLISILFYMSLRLTYSHIYTYMSWSLLLSVQRSTTPIRSVPADSILHIEQYLPSIFLLTRRYIGTVHYHYIYLNNICYPPQHVYDSVQEARLHDTSMMRASFWRIMRFGLKKKIRGDTGRIMRFGLENTSIMRKCSHHFRIIPVSCKITHDASKYVENTSQ